MMINGTNVTPAGAGYGILPFQVIDPIHSDDWCMEFLDNGTAGSPSLSCIFGDPNGLTLRQFQVNTAATVGWIFDATNGLCLSTDGGETLTTIVDNYGNVAGGPGLQPMGDRTEPGPPDVSSLTTIGEWLNAFYTSMVDIGWINDNLNT
jgi:hypothetical protein